jgi:hypothetical protein
LPGGIAISKLFSFARSLLEVVGRGLSCCIAFTS